MFKKIFIYVFTVFFSIQLYSQSICSLNSSDSISWRVFPVDMDSSSVAVLSTPGYDVSTWIPSKVPGTYFVDYVNAGIEKDPDFGDNIYNVDEKKYNKEFWYRTEFEVPAGFTKDKLWLNFKGVNKEGTFILNGELLGSVTGFMLRSVFDVSTKVKTGKNVLLVKTNVPDVRKSRQPTWALDTWANFAMPTYMASAGWDWMPYVPGLNCGITNDVYLSTTGVVKLEDVWVRSEVPDIKQANISINATIHNCNNQSVTGTLTGTILPGNILFSKTITLSANQSLPVKINKDEFTQLTISNPLLWYPNGYGTPNLYTLNLSFNVNNEISDVQTVTFGVRKYDYKNENGAFTLYVNNSKVLVRGGNWGMTEYLQRSRGKEYDTRIKLHADMNFNMIRCWTGCVTDDEFYDYCDKYGIMVWDDFWFHGSLFAPDESLFMSNAVDKIKRLRNHPCIAVWCGANEGVPAGNLDTLLKTAVGEYDGNDRHYQSCSNSGGGLSGSGWWENMNPKNYFTGPGSGGGDWSGAGTWAFRSEIGTAAFTTFESFQEFMPVDSWWPPKNEMWNKHYFGAQAAAAGSDTYYNTVCDNYGAPAGIDEFCEKSQYLNLEVMKAIYEGWNDNMWNNATGVLIWMSQSAYPSFVWQTYDYYFDATGAYWGAKKACEPLHIQWNYANNSVKVINTTLTNYTALKAKATVYNLKGEVYTPLSMEKTLDAGSNTATECFVLAEKNLLNLALSKNVFASANTNDAEGVPGRAVDGNLSSRWGSGYQNNAWFYVDLGSGNLIDKVKIYWESAYGRNYQIMVSDDAANWTTVYTQNSGTGGTETISFPPVTARYVKFQGVERGTMWGYSFYEFEVYAPTQHSAGDNTVELSNLSFIKLQLLDAGNNTVSENFYWRNMDEYNYKDLNTLPKADVSITETRKKENGNCLVSCNVTNNSSTVAFGNRLKVINKQTGKRVLPIFMNDNYFTLMPNESKKIDIQFAEALVGNADFEVVLKQYGDYNSTPTGTAVESINDNNSFSLTVFPNPVHQILTINKPETSIKVVKIVDMYGNLVYFAKKTSTIDVSKFPKGIYILTAIVDDRVYNTKFQKN